MDLRPLDNPVSTSPRVAVRPGRRHNSSKYRPLANQRTWLRLRDDCAQPSRNDATIVACLEERYSQRLTSMRAPSFADNARKAMASTASCQTISERYKPLAHAHRGGWPIQLLAESKTSGMTIADAPGLSTVNAVSELPEYGAAQHPPAAGLAWGDR
jgi:hypothetical protein